MGKSMVLKDGANRPGGYVIASEREILCRAQTDEPGQLVMFFADGSQRMHELHGCTEQRFAGEKAEITGCCVVCRACVVLASDEAARRAGTFLGAVRRKEAENRGRQTDCSETRGERVHAGDEWPHRSGSEKEQNAFAQRRWPPPPCWQTACYRQGRWQDEGEDVRETDKPL